MRLTGVAFAPMAPLLFRHLSGAADPVADLREAAVAAVRNACRDATEVLVLCPVGGREAPGDWRDPSHSGAVHGQPRSLAEQVGAHLLSLAGVDLPAAYAECADGVAAADPLAPEGGGHVALVVLGDGAAARSQGAPGHIDDRSFPFDDHVADALAAGDGAALAALAQAAEAGELLVSGRHSWPVLGRLVPRASEADLTWRGDPFGLSYFVAIWRP